MYPVAAVLQYTVQYNTVHKITHTRIQLKLIQIPPKCDILPSEDVKKSLQIEFVALAHLADGQFLKDGLTSNKGKPQEFPSGNSRTNNGPGRWGRF